KRGTLGSLSPRDWLISAWQVASERWEDLQAEQQVCGALADMLIALFSEESATIRAGGNVLPHDESKGVLAWHARDRLLAESTEIMESMRLEIMLAGTGEGASAEVDAWVRLPEARSGLKGAPALRRALAEAVIAANGYS